MIRVGVDIGGTFTDLIVFDEGSGRLESLKVLTTPREPWVGVIRALEEASVDIEGVDVVIHATTLGTNMFLGQEGLEPPSAVLITNRGFRDVLEIGRQNRPELYNLYFTRPKPLVPRDRRLVVKGRIDARGNVVEDIDRGEVARLAKEWCGRADVFIVSMLNSHINPVHEDEIGSIITRECPGAIVVEGARIDPQEKEYERTSTAVVNGLLKPILSKYLKRLKSDLEGRGFKGILLLMQSSGGVSTVDYAVERPAAFIESGPAAGAIAVSYYATMQGVGRAIGFDMGGTTAKASSIIDGEPLVVREYEVGAKVHMGRPLRGSGYPVRYPYIDLVEVSAGGGTIAWVDPGGAVRVGPVSAGADPGPACYGLGGDKPTLTDANLVLGRLPEALAWGRIKLYRDLAVRALASIADKAGLEVDEAAWAVIRIANTVMGKALRLVTVERGYDPREFTLYAFGGAGPLHAAEIGEELSVSRVVIPPYPGVFSSLGLLVADYRHDYYRSIMRSAYDPETQDAVEEAFKGLEEEAIKTLRSEGFSDENIRLVRTLDMRYRGQAYDLSIPYRGSVEGSARSFEEVHEGRYGHRLPGEDVVVVNVRLSAVGVTSKPRLPRGEVVEGRAEPRGYRRVYFKGGWLETPIYWRGDLRPGASGNGPAVVESPDSTIVVPPGYRFRVEGDYSVVMERW
ncbi:hydantoin utilization protein A [Aeropyrum pernix K1]|uniref:Hydantoin utilization protein A n=1 Tax=Aeropyrum pernix (strain ATCC 700893 / DSM 11879 / JCM 9820 / NBRC 100138 / K1) TaxID=272557 RepID=Q9Y8V6_AERPE|nr:hydantoinase/oxoprolinase family protein [Aeropyrum pernix]BAA81544.2 hydantoin utilization protein A [Aeropyrum pernix K1]